MEATNQVTFNKPNPTNVDTMLRDLISSQLSDLVCVYGDLAERQSESESEREVKASRESNESDRT